MANSYVRPERTSEGLEWYLKNERISQSIFVAKRPLHELETDNPRSLPQRTLSDVCTLKNDELRINEFMSLMKWNDIILWFPLYSNKVESEKDISIPISPEDLWSICSPTDWLLLADHRAEHYTRVSYIDGDRVYLLDPWPHLFPIKRGKICKERGLVFLEKESFLNDIVGLLTFDEADFILNYINARPHLYEDYEFLFSCGNILLLRNSKAVAAYAAYFLGKALYVAFRADSQKWPLIAAKQYLALLELEAFHKQRPYLPFPEKFKGELQRTCMNCGIEMIIQNLDHEEILRAAKSWMIMHEFNIAQEFLYYLVSNGSENDEVFLNLANLFFSMENKEQAQKNVEVGLNLNAKLTSKIETEIENLKASDTYNRELLEQKKKYCIQKKKEFKKILEKTNNC